MTSSANVFVATTPAERRLHPSTSRSRPSGTTVALALSITVHLGFALLAMRPLRTTLVTPDLGDELIELTTELEPLSPALEPQSESKDAAPSPASQLPPAAPRVVGQSAFARPAAPLGSPKLSHAEPTFAKSESPPIPATSQVAESPAPRFTITLTKSAGSASLNPASGSVPEANTMVTAGAANLPLPVASVDVPARLRAGNAPTYTPAALAAGIEANVPLEIVVSEGGLVTSARGLEHVGYGLDEAARQSVLGYRFTPAMRNNRPVPVRMRWLMRFQLR